MNNTINKIKVKSISFPFSESNEVNTKITFSCFAAANAHLRGVEKPDLGYYKTDFVVVFEDGREYKGRYDIGSDYPTLEEHIISFCSTYSLRHRPAHFKDEHWKHFCEMYKGESAERYGEYLDNYEFGD